MKVSDAFEAPLVDLGSQDPLYRGIFSPEAELGVPKQGVSAQFLENAEVYHQKYNNPSSWCNIFNLIFKETGKPQVKKPKILDIGTGSGENTIVPFLRMFDDCEIVGTDISPQLLAMLRRFVVREKLEKRVSCVCTDAMKNFFKAGYFDIVIGGSILHHLLDPTSALRAAFRALKPGGTAIFVEPFEGYGVLRSAFELILERVEAGEGPGVSPEALAFIRAMSRDFEARAGSDKSAPFVPYLDDKWLFTRSGHSARGDECWIRHSEIRIALRSSRHLPQWCAGSLSDQRNQPGKGRSRVGVENHRYV